MDSKITWKRLGLAMLACAAISLGIFAVFLIVGPPECPRWPFCGP